MALNTGMDHPIGLTDQQTTEYFKFLELAEDDVASLRSPSLRGLELLLVRHLAAAPFGNLDIHYHQSHAIKIDLDAIFDKVVRRRRGGYCMELNGLFSALLTTLGFNTWLVGARVTADKSGSSRKFNGISHCLSMIEFDNGDVYVADVGFGGTNMVRPVKLVPGTVVDGVGCEQHRLVKEAVPQMRNKKPYWILQHKADKDTPFIDSYMFFDDEVYFKDFEIMSNWTSTKEWIFVENLLLARVIRDGDKPVGRYTLFNRGIKKRLYSEIEDLPELSSEEGRVKALKEFWGIELSQEDQRAIRGRATEIVPGPQILTGN